jgi:hypothetical protein
MLISYKADINAKTNAKNTPLHLAAIFGHDGAGMWFSLVCGLVYMWFSALDTRLGDLKESWFILVSN